MYGTFHFIRLLITSVKEEARFWDELSPNSHDTDGDGLERRGDECLRLVRLSLISRG